MTIEMIDKWVTGLRFNGRKRNENKMFVYIYIFYFYFFIFYFIKSHTNDSYVNHFDGHFAYLKTLDFSFKVMRMRHCQWFWSGTSFRVTICTVLSADVGKTTDRVPRRLTRLCSLFSNSFWLQVSASFARYKPVWF